jgi:hypothetical protein
LQIRRERIPLNRRRVDRQGLRIRRPYESRWTGKH